MATMEEIKRALEADKIDFSEEQLKAVESLVNNPPPEGKPLTEAQMELISGGGFWTKARNTLIGAGILTGVAAAAYFADDRFNEGKGWAATKDFAGDAYGKAAGMAGDLYGKGRDLLNRGGTASAATTDPTVTVGGGEEGADV